jgi:hypothetical protein
MAIGRSLHRLRLFASFVVCAFVGHRAAKLVPALPATFADKDTGSPFQAPGLAAFIPRAVWVRIKRLPMDRTIA